MNTGIRELLHLYLGCDITYRLDVKHAKPIQTKNRVEFLAYLENCMFPGFFDAEENKPKIDYIKLHLRPISDITDEELLHCGSILCAIPNHESKEFTSKIKRSSNTVGAHYTSKHYHSVNYFTIWNETDKNPGHTETGWFSGMDKRKTKELWKVAANHRLTIYLLKQGFDLFGLIGSGHAISTVMDKGVTTKTLG